MPYNIWNAAAYEITNILIQFDARWQNIQIVKMVRSHCFLDWVEWKTERTMKKVDVQIAELQKEMEQTHLDTYVKPILTEHQPDGSKAQELLGGELQLTAPWLKSEQSD